MINTIKNLQIDDDTAIDAEPTDRVEIDEHKEYEIEQYNEETNNVQNNNSDAESIGVALEKLMTRYNLQTQMTKKILIAATKKFQE